MFIYLLVTLKFLFRQYSQNTGYMILCLKKTVSEEFPAYIELSMILIPYNSFWVIEE